MKNIIENLMEKQEKESWEEKSSVYFLISFPKTIKTEHGQRQEYFRMERVEQSRIYPHGITKEMAIAFAGKSGKVWKKYTKVFRLK